MIRLTDAVAYVSEVEHAPPHFQALTERPLVVMVGLTGVGKSTILKALAQRGVDYTPLPDRREITNQIIIALLQQEDGQSIQPVFDRVKRFEYTARYRAKFPGGMAHALSRIVVDPAQTRPLLVFDGLRGLNEVQHAISYFPRARFVMLDAPDMIRLNRLLKREDAFDTTTIRTSLATQNLMAALTAVPNIEAVFAEEQLRQIARTARATEISADAVVKKITIIVEERRNYDSSAARVHLTRTLAPKQVLVLDTSTHPVDVLARRMAEWLTVDSK